MGQRSENSGDDNDYFLFFSTIIYRYWPRGEKFHSIKINCMANNVEHLEFRVRFPNFSLRSQQ
jgi:hypothetical protein